MNAWIFDVDGVISSLKTRKVEHEEILHFIVERLEKGEPVGIITGRAFPWLNSEILKRFEIETSLKNLKNLFVCAEFGGIVTTYSPEKITTTDENLTLPQDLVEKCKKVIENYKEVFTEDKKVTHYTAVVREGIDDQLFLDTQKKLAEKIEDIIKESNLEDKVEAHKDTIAVNVKNKNLNKHMATDKFIRWIKDNKFTIDQYFAFGDSESDLQIGEELYSQNQRLVFIYTGEKEINEYPFEIIKTNKKYDDGTLEYLINN